MDRQRRRELGAWYTPPDLVDAVVAATLHRWVVPSGRPVTVLDPACGDGRFLVAVERALRARGATVRLVGVDIDPVAVAAARAALADCDATVVETDALASPLPGQATDVDLVVGNPPFLSPLASRNARVASSTPSGAPYADAATQFLLLAWRSLRRGGRVGFVLPQSVLANRDAAVARAAVAAQGALRWVWWSPRRVFEASVRTCAIVAERGPSAGRRRVRRRMGPDFAVVADAPHPGDEWGALVADLGGVPHLPDGLAADGALADRALPTAGFRDEFYGIAVAVDDDAEGPPLVTSGLIDPGRCWWGEREVRVARRRYVRPRVRLGDLPDGVRRWADRQLVPKVLVASQTKVIEAVADVEGSWLPGVPVVAVVPRDPGADSVWAVAAALTNPVASAALVRAGSGTGLSASTVRVSAKALAAVPWPAGDLTDAIGRLRAGDVEGCGLAGLLAFGLDPAGPAGRTLMDWWAGALPAAVRGQRFQGAVGDTAPSPPVSTS